MQTHWTMVDTGPFGTGGFDMLLVLHSVKYGVYAAIIFFLVLHAYQEM